MTARDQPDEDGEEMPAMKAERKTDRRSQPGVTPRPRGEERRAAILAEARSLFAGGGFYSVSLADIAQEVGITQAGILHYFPSKAALLIAVLQERDDENNASRVIREAAGATSVDAFVGMLFDNDRHPELVQLFVVLAAESTAEGHPGHEWFQERNERMTRLTTEWMHQVIDPSKLPAGLELSTLGRWLMAMSHGLGAQWVLNPAAFDRAGAVAQFVDLLRPYMRDAPLSRPTTTPGKL